MNNVKTIAKLKKRITKTLKDIEEMKTQIKERPKNNYWTEIDTIQMMSEVAYFMPQLLDRAKTYKITKDFIENMILESPFLYDQAFNGRSDIEWNYLNEELWGRFKDYSN